MVEPRAILNFSAPPSAAGKPSPPPQGDAVGGSADAEARLAQPAFLSRGAARRGADASADRGPLGAARTQTPGARPGDGARESLPFLAQLLAQEEACEAAQPLPAEWALGRYREAPRFRVVFLGPEVSLDLLV